MDMYEKIKKLRLRKGLSQDELAEKVGYTHRSSIGKVESGLVDLSQSKIQAFADALGTTTSYLMGWEEESKHITTQLSHTTRVINVHIYSVLSCGSGGFVDDNIIDTITLPAEMFKNPNKEFFGQYASGDSMIEAGINDGDLLIFEQTNIINQGQIGCFCIDENTATCKKYTVAEDNIIYLVPANSNYAPIRIDVTNECFRVVGRYVTRITKEI